MGRRISKEFLHPSILEGVNNKIGNLDNLETDAKDNMVQAINELADKIDTEIAEGKELIANAVGEPLTAEESFDEMSNDINSLLSTFKTNMMNNGITVESGDKFKALIDKIATMVEEGSDKGIQFAEGTFTANIYNFSDNNDSETINYSPGFIPNYIFVKFTELKEGYDNGSIENALVSNLSTATFPSGVYSFSLSLSDITENSFKINCDSYYGVYDMSGGSWYAIGVGEEDTTLRDSLASILENKGVDVTEEDDMASLITKVDNISGGLDIISATELPATGRENQICVITDNPDNKMVFVTNLNDIDHSTNDIYIYLGTTEANSYNTGKTYDCNNGNFTFKLYIVKIYQNSKNLASYIYQNGTWVEYTYDYKYFIENSVLTNSEIFGTLVSGNAMKATSAPAVYICSPSDSGGYPYHIATTNKKIDFSLYNYIEVVGYHQSSSGSITMMCYDSTRNGHYGSYVSNIHYADPVESFTTTSSVVTYDIRSWTSTGYLGFSYTTQDGSQYIYITDVRLR